MCTIGINDTGAKLPLVLTTPTANFATGIAGGVIPCYWYQRSGGNLPPINDNGGKFAQVVNNGNIIILLTPKSELEG
jgi:hypothetical protein